MSGNAVSTQSVSPLAVHVPSRLRRVAAITAVAVIAGGGGLVAVAPSAQAAPSASASAGAFLGHLNALRAQHGRAGLSMYGDLNNIASGWAAHMAAVRGISHNPGLASQVSNWQKLGENVGMGPSVSAIDNAFDASPGHYANEVDASYTQVGIGVASDSRGEIYVTVDFRRPMYGAPAPRPAPRPVAKPAPRPAPRPAPKPVAKPAPKPLPATVNRAAARLTTGAAQAPTLRVTAAKRAAAVAKAATTKSAAVRAAAKAAKAQPALAGTDPVARALNFTTNVAKVRAARVQHTAAKAPAWPATAKRAARPAVAKAPAWPTTAKAPAWPAAAQAPAAAATPAVVWANRFFGAMLRNVIAQWVPAYWLAAWPFTAR